MAVEAVAQSIINPFEVISSEDMLSRVNDCNEKLKKLQEMNGNEWCLNEEMILLGTDVKSLFPCLSAEMTGRCVRKQFQKSAIKWENVDLKLVTLYIKLHKKFWKGPELSEIKKYLPERISKVGRPPSIGTIAIESKYRWPTSFEILLILIQSAI